MGDETNEIGGMIHHKNHKKTKSTNKKKEFRRQNSEDRIKTIPNSF